MGTVVCMQLYSYIVPVLYRMEFDQCFHGVVKFNYSCSCDYGMVRTDWREVVLTCETLGRKLVNVYTRQDCLN